jgi:CRISPR-associated protein Cmr1
MQKVEVTLETVTPVFLGGADGKPELRPPPFRGLMRYWFRAMAGGVVGDSKSALEQIKKKEAEIFGSPDEKSGGQSAVWVRLAVQKFEKNEVSLLPHKNGPKREAILPNTTLTITLTLKPGAEIKKLEIATWNLLVGLTLGGVGKRSRRGFGSLRIKQKPAGEGLENLNPTLLACLDESSQIAINAKALAERIVKIQAGARIAFEEFLGRSTQSISNLPTFSLIRPDTQIVIWTPPDNSLGDYKSALIPLMKLLSDTMRKNEATNFAKAFGGILNRERRASPLWVSTHRLQNEWALVLTYLKAKYQDGEAGHQESLVTDFFNSLSPKPITVSIGAEVKS